MNQSYSAEGFRKETVQTAASRKVDPRIFDALRAMNQDLPASAVRDRNRELLSKPGTVFLVTGQQVGLFLGPLFTIYKTLSLIQTAKALETECGTPVVPLFWLQSEDHDIAEINICSIPTAEVGPTQLRVELDASLSDRISVSERKLGGSVEDVLQCAIAESNLSAGPEVTELFTRSYRSEATFASAFRSAMAELFREDGLLFFDPRHPLVPPLAQPFYQKAFDDLDTLDEALLRRVAELRAKDLPEQVRVRAGSPLFFLHSGGPSGPRYRLSRDGSAFVVVGSSGGQTLAPDEIRELLRAHPERFSSSALLRPLIQDSLLPSAGYIAGPAEQNYFRQIEPLYSHFGLRQPLVIPRASFVLVDPKIRRLCEQLGLSAVTAPSGSKDFVRQILAESLPADVQPAAVQTALEEGLLGTLQKVRERASAVDNRFSGAFDRTEEKLARTVEGVLDRYRKLVVDRDNITKERAEKLEQLISPNGVPQERSYSFLPFWCKFGPDLLARLRAAFVPYHSAPRAVEL